MAVGTIVIDTDNRTDSDICDDLLEHDVVIAELGTRPAARSRRESIGDELRQRPERWGKEGNVLLLSFVVNSEGRICTYDTIDDLDNFDVFDVLFLTDRDAVTLDGVTAAIERFTPQWRAKGKPGRYHTHFEYETYADEDDATD